jgi:hypothetical protein
MIMNSGTVENFSNQLQEKGLQNKLKNMQQQEDATETQNDMKSFDTIMQALRS